MAQAGDTVGLGVRVYADVSELKKALKEGSVEVLTTTANMEKLASSLRGDKLIQNAHNITAAIKEVGVTTLSSSQAATQLSTLERAMDQIARNGQPVPALMKATADELRQIAPAASTANSTLDSIWTGLKGAAGLMGVSFGVSAIVNFTGKVFDAASAIKDNSVALGYSTEAFQRNKFAAEQSGGSVEAFTKAANKLNDNLAGGGDSTVAALNAVGLKFDDIRRMRPEDAWTAVTNAVGSVEDPMLRANAAQDLFGKGALALLPGMIEGYDKLGASATVMSDKTIERLEAAQDTWDAFWNSIVIHSADVIAAFTDIAGDEGHGGAMAGLAANYAGTTAQVLQNNRDMAESTKTLSADVINEEKAMGRAMAERVAIVIPKSKEQLAAEKKNAAERAAALKKSQDDTVKSQEDAWKDTLAAQKVYTATAERENAEMFAQMERDQATDVKLAEQAWLDRLAAQKQYTEASKAEMDAFWKDMDAKDKASVDAAKKAIDEKERASHEGWGRVRDDASAILTQVEGRVADSVVSLIGHWSHWRSVSAEIWGEVRDGISRVLSDILQEFESRFIKGLIASITGAEGGFVGAFRGLFSTAGKAGGQAMTSSIGTEVSLIPPNMAAPGAASGSAFAAAFNAIAGPAVAAYIGWKIATAVAAWFGDGPGDKHTAPDERTGYPGTPHDPGGRDPGNPDNPTAGDGGMNAPPGPGGTDGRNDNSNSGRSSGSENYEDQNRPGYALGTGGRYVDFGTRTTVDLHGRERVVTEAEGRAEAGGLQAAVAAMRAMVDEHARTMRQIVTENRLQMMAVLR